MASTGDDADANGWSISAGNTDSDTDGTGPFAIDSGTGEITVSDAGDIDFETTPSYTLTIAINDGTGDDVEASVTITITDVNDNAPTDIAITASTASETATQGTEVGTLSATDADTTGTYTYTVVENANGDAYTGSDWAIDGTTLEVGTSPDFDYETSTSESVFIEVNDGADNTYVEELTITITDTAISITANSANLAENAADDDEVLTMASTGDAANGAGWSITAGNDAGIFAINSGTGVVTVADNTNLDYETTTSYDITFSISDGTAADTEVVTITITDVNDNAPTDIAITASTVLSLIHI